MNTATQNVKMSIAMGGAANVGSPAQRSTSGDRSAKLFPRKEIDAEERHTLCPLPKDLVKAVVGSGEHGRAQQKGGSNSRRVARMRMSIQGTLLPLNYSPKKVQTLRMRRLAYLRENIHHEQLPGGCWVGKRLPASKSGGTQTLAELIGKGYRLVEWDGRTPHAIVDDNETILGMLVGRPESEPTYDASIAAAAKAMSHARDTGIRTGVFRKEPEQHRRGKFTAVASGVSYGGGQTKPGNLVLDPLKASVVEELLKNSDIRRIATFQSASFALFAPKLFNDYMSNLKLLYAHLPTLRPNFPGISVFPAATFNLGPETSTSEHTDSANVAYGWCAITPFGTFDPKMGGHLVLHDLKLIIEFPPGSTILIPSSLLRHSNTPIVGEGAVRMSLAQYCAGGIFRWVQYGFQTAKSLASTACGKATQRRVDGTPSQRAKAAMLLFSTLGSLAADRMEVFGLVAA